MQICRYADVSDGIKNEIKAINEGEENNYGKDYMKIKFSFNDDLPLNKPLKFHAVTIIIRSVFEEGGKRYRQVFQMTLGMNYKNTTIRKKQCFRRNDTNKTSLSKEYELFHYWYFKDVGFKFELLFWI